MLSVHIDAMGSIFRFYIFLLLCVFTAVSSYAQENLVSNPGFENSKKCPPTHSYLNGASPWYTPGKGTTDWFCECRLNSGGPVSVPQNLSGYQQASEGKCYAGFVAYYKFSPTYAEYMAIKLTRPLKKGEKYYVRFYYSLSDYSTESVNEIAVWTSKAEFVQREYYHFRASPAALNTEPLSTDTSDWHLYEAEFVAKGGEEHLMIGAPLKYTHSTLHETPLKNPKEEDPYDIVPFGTAYYLIDNVYIGATDPGWTDIIAREEKKSSDSLIIIKDSVSLTLDQVFVFNNLHFQTDKSEILPVSFHELDKLAEYLRKNPDVMIVISGHTDNQGDPDYNKTLSLNRARAVADYLYMKGVSYSRITTAGYGSEKPVDNNNTPEGRAKNRRVEFVLSRKD